jgi:mono/diheme cytochrome c family protein
MIAPVRFETCRVAVLAMALGVQAPGMSGTPADPCAAEVERQARGRAALRAMDCARCHGRNHDGWAAPSLLEAVRQGSRERFDRMVLDGDPSRGMPGYRSQPLVVAELDAIYAYLVVRASAAGAAAPRCGSN